MGPNCSAPMTPSLKGELVNSRTSQAWATVCIQVPIREMSWPARKRRKSRWARARRPMGNRIHLSPEWVRQTGPLDYLIA